MHETPTIYDEHFKRNIRIYVSNRLTLFLSKYSIINTIVFYFFFTMDFGIKARIFLTLMFMLFSVPSYHEFREKSEYYKGMNPPIEKYGVTRTNNFFQQQAHFLLLIGILGMNVALITKAIVIAFF